MKKNVPSLEVSEVDLDQCNLVDNQINKVWSIIHFYTSNESYANLLNVVPGNSVFLKT